MVCLSKWTTYLDQEIEENGSIWELFMNLWYVHKWILIYLKFVLYIYIIDYILYESKIGIILKNVYIKNIRDYI